MSGGTGRAWRLDAEGNPIGEGQPFEFTSLTVTPITHTAVDDYTCSCGWTVDNYTAPEIARWKLKTKHLGGFTGTETPSPEHVMVTPGYPPVRIGDGPTISLHVEDDWTPNGSTIHVGDTPQFMPHPYPTPTPIHGTPYEAYAEGTWALNVFAIRLRHDTPTPGGSQEDEPEACIRRGGICWPQDPAIEAAFNEAKGQQP